MWNRLGIFALLTNLILQSGTAIPPFWLSMEGASLFILCPRVSPGRNINIFNIGAAHSISTDKSVKSMPIQSHKCTKQIKVQLMESMKHREYDGNHDLLNGQTALWFLPPTLHEHPYFTLHFQHHPYPFHETTLPPAKKVDAYWILINVVSSYISHVSSWIRYQCWHNHYGQCISMIISHFEKGDEF